MTTAAVRLRAFTSDDYPGWVAASNICYPDYPWSLEEARHQDGNWDHVRFFKTRIVAEEGGRIVGSVDVNHRPSRFHPDRYGVDHIKTWNDQRNRPMLAINEALGFAKQPAWIGLELRLRP